MGSDLVRGLTKEELISFNVPKAKVPAFNAAVSIHLPKPPARRSRTTTRSKSPTPRSKSASRAATEPLARAGSLTRATTEPPARVATEAPMEEGGTGPRPAKKVCARICRCEWCWSGGGGE